MILRQGDINMEQFKKNKLGLIEKNKLEPKLFIDQKAKEIMTGYCSKCHKMTGMDNVKEEQLKNETKVYKGKCLVCGTEIYKTIKE